MSKKISELSTFSGAASNFVIPGVDTVAGETKKATFQSLMSAIGDARMLDFTADNLVAGAMLFYDRLAQTYKVVAQSKVVEVLADYDSTRYTTNYDTYIGTQGGMAHFCAITDATAWTLPSPGNDNEPAATSCYYRITIDNTISGSVKFTASSGNATLTDQVLSWSAGDTMASIAAKFAELNASYITFGALADGTGVGLEIGGYGANTFVLDASSTGATVTDMTNYAMLRSANPTVKVGDTFVPGGGYTYMNTSTHKSWRGNAAATLLGSSLVAADSRCKANNGKQYSYLVGINKSKFRQYAISGGSDTFVSDGVNGSSGGNAAVVMKKTTFDANVNSSATSGSDAAKMYEYYNNLLTGATTEYATKRATYQGWYGTMTDLFDAYIMSHMMDISDSDYIVNSMRNKGYAQTTAKADVLNVTYDYAIVPAYPPEYNAVKYGNSAKDGFTPGSYYHDEPGDLGLMFRDDIMALINANVTAVNSAVAAGTGVALVNSMYRGSSADGDANYSWYFSGGVGSFYGNVRYSRAFRCRPVLALSIPA